MKKTKTPCLNKNKIFYLSKKQSTHHKTTKAPIKITVEHSRRNIGVSPRLKLNSFGSYYKKIVGIFLHKCIHL